MGPISTPSSSDLLAKAKDSVSSNGSKNDYKTCKNSNKTKGVPKSGPGLSSKKKTSNVPKKKTEQKKSSNVVSSPASKPSSAKTSNNLPGKSRVETHPTQTPKCSNSGMSKPDKTTATCKSSKTKITEPTISNPPVKGIRS